MFYVFQILALIFVLKLIWNLMIPVVIAFIWSKPDRETKGVALAPVEFVVLIILVSMTYVDDGLALFGFRRLGLLGIGLFSAVTTYLFIWALLKAFASRFK